MQEPIGTRGQGLPRSASTSPALAEEVKRCPAAGTGITATVKNRRYARLLQLMAAGEEFFTLEAMQLRAPLLFRQHVGVLQRPHETSSLVEQFARATRDIHVAERLAREEAAEAALLATQRTATPDLADDVDEPGGRWGEFAASRPSPIAVRGTQHARGADAGAPEVGDAEAEADFLQIMQERFLSGEESSEFVDYPSIDADSRLDRRWAREIAADAEEAYFGC